MKIGLVSPYDFAYPGGVVEHIAHLATGFQRLGHQVQIIAPWSGAGPLPSTLVDHQIGSVVPVPVNGSVARITLSPMVAHRVKRILQTERFDVVHLHEPLMPVLPLTVLRYSEAVNVGTFHAYRPSHLAYRYGRALLGFFFRRLHGRIAVSPAAHQLISRCFVGEYEIIPNGIELARFGEHVAPLPTLRDGRPTILFVGRFNEPRKGLRYLLQALPLLRRAVPNVRLIIVGQGSTERLRSRLARLQLDNVHLVGYVSARMLPRYYASCDIFCAPSVGQESFGIVLLEAMAAGRPVVASRIAGYTSVVSDGCQGLLVEPAAPSALAQALIRLFEDRGLAGRLAELGRRTAAEYDWDRISRRIVRYYEEVSMPAGRLMGGVG